jgi:GntR family transcriptional regulator
MHSRRYERIRADIARQIAERQLMPGDRLESERELARRYGVSIMTVRHAVGLLVSEGRVAKQWGVGTFVVPQPLRHRPMNRLQSFRADLAEVGHRVETRVVAQMSAHPPDKACRALAAAASATMLRLDRLRVVEGRAVAFQRTWLPEPLASLVGSTELVEGSLYQTLELVAGIRLASADQLLTAVEAERQIAGLLGLPVHAALIYIERTAFDEAQVPVEYTQSWTIPSLPVSFTLEAAGRTTRAVAAMPAQSQRFAPAVPFPAMQDGRVVEPFPTPRLPEEEAP